MEILQSCKANAVPKTSLRGAHVDWFDSLDVKAGRSNRSKRDNVLFWQASELESRKVKQANAESPNGEIYIRSANGSNGSDNTPLRRSRLAARAHG